MSYSKTSRCAGSPFFEDPFLRRSRRWRPCVREKYVHDSPVQELDQVYVLEGREAVDSFVQTNPTVLDILRVSSAQLDKFFGPQASKVLRVVEDDEGASTLFCFVRFSGHLADAMRALEAFDECWWLERCAPVAGRLNFDFELV
jgi:hypothetical protein